MQLPFAKMHGLGNDFMVVRDQPDAALPAAADIRRLAHRREGVGFDQLLWVEPPRSPGTDAYYRVFNADGGEVAQCGNGLRCIARLLGAGAGAPETLRLESRAGIFEARSAASGQVSVTMGEPRFAPPDIPLDAAAEAATYVLEAGGSPIEVSALSMGNPHCVLLADDIGSAPVADLGPLLETHPAFPERCNVGFLQPETRARAALRVWERGVGETRACGSGACAAMVAGRRRGLFDEEVRISLPGGDLMVSWRGPGEPVWLTGPAEHAFEGTVRL
ncbi:MAG: diaminopimelate epimerase [Gammaproteobacteria bacterium]|jgi:diaminopimelate epimerase